MKYNHDIDALKSCLSNIPLNWDGKKCIMELKEANYNWKQMEWWAFYFEYKAKNLLINYFDIPGERNRNVIFDLQGRINWDLKASAIKSHSHTIILNDKDAMDNSIKKHGYHGEIIGLCDVEYNDVNRTFQKWHTKLKGGKSDYEKSREKRTSVSRYRKTRAELTEILFLVLTEKNVSDLSIMNQGRNSNGAPRKVKYMLDLENITEILKEKIEF